LGAESCALFIQAGVDLFHFVESFFSSGQFFSRSGVPLKAVLEQVGESGLAVRSLSDPV